MFDIKNPDTFLGGANVQRLFIMFCVGYMAYKCYHK